MKRTPAKQARKAPKTAPHHKAAEATTPLDLLADTGRGIIKLATPYREHDELRCREKMPG